MVSPLVRNLASPNSYFSQRLWSVHRFYREEINGETYVLLKKLSYHDVFFQAPILSPKCVSSNTSQFSDTNWISDGSIHLVLTLHPVLTQTSQGQSSVHKTVPTSDASSKWAVQITHTSAWLTTNSGILTIPLGLKFQ